MPRLLRALLIVIIGLALAVAACFAFLKTFADRHNQCLCVDGIEVSGWSTGWTKPSRHCAELCAPHGGGRSLRPD